MPNNENPRKKRPAKKPAQPAQATVSGGEVVVEQIAPGFLQELRNRNAQIQTIQNGMQSLITGYTAGKLWNTETHDVNFDMDAGVVTAKLKSTTKK